MVCFAYEIANVILKTFFSCVHTVCDVLAACHNRTDFVIGNESSE